MASRWVINRRLLLQIDRLSTPLVNTTYQHILSCHPVNPSYQHILSTHPSAHVHTHHPQPQLPPSHILPIGWTVGPAKFVRPMQELLPCVQFCASTPIQHALTIALPKAEQPYMGEPSYYEWLRQQFLSKRSILEDGLRAAGDKPFNITLTNPFTHPSLHSFITSNVHLTGPPSYLRHAHSQNN